MNKILFCIFFNFFGIYALAQLNTPSEGVIDGVYVQEHISLKRAIPFEFVREADVMFQKRVWRTIDLREKINHPLYFPHDDFYGNGDSQQWIRNTNRWAFWSVLRHHILTGEIVVYEKGLLNGPQDGDSFKYPIQGPAPGKSFDTDERYKKDIIDKIATVIKSKEDLVDGAGNPVYEYITNPTTGVKDSVPKKAPDVIEYIKSKDIIEYKLKEDWFFDKERSQFDCRILGIAPVAFFDDEGNVVHTEAADTTHISKKDVLFWLYFPHIRSYINTYNVYNPKNDANWMSFDDLFQKRMFSSTIYKQSNIYDRALDSYKSGIEALYESQRITEELRNFEHDLWHF